MSDDFIDRLVESPAANERGINWSRCMATPPRMSAADLDICYGGVVQVENVPYVELDANGEITKVEIFDDTIFQLVDITAEYQS
ncbi:MAG TPA: hypothetical protein VMV19_18195 [Xanthobacteraceae bacterium]|nr:hypothetical protein [Xanthobacteraceae bacterium]